MHRDVKPGNIMLDENDRPYLIDLGLARSLEKTEYTTLTGRPLGTAAYMSPEQARGASEIGSSTDVYGLGATLFTLLTGRPPFTGPGPMVVLRKVIDEEPAWPRERDRPVGVELKAICLKCLEKNPANRFGSAGELAAGSQEVPQLRADRRYSSTALDSAGQMGHAPALACAGHGDRPDRRNRIHRGRLKTAKPIVTPNRAAYC